MAIERLFFFFLLFFFHPSANKGFCLIFEPCISNNSIMRFTIKSGFKQRPQVDLFPPFSFCCICYSFLGKPQVELVCSQYKKLLSQYSLQAQASGFFKVRFNLFHGSDCSRDWQRSSPILEFLGCKVT